MANERTYPALPCRDVEESVAFYESIGFKRTYRQVRPYPYAVVAREDLHIHLFGMDGFEPANSYGTAIVVVPDPDALYQDFAAGLRKARGKLPVTGIPRITRPRKKYGTVRGFSVVDPGGNWLRISKLGESEETDSAEKATGLAQIFYVATRLGDSRGDERAGAEDARERPDPLRPELQPGRPRARVPLPRGAGGTHERSGLGEVLARGRAVGRAQLGRANCPRRGVRGRRRAGGSGRTSA